MAELKIRLSEKTTGAGRTTEATIPHLNFFWRLMFSALNQQ